MSRSQRSDGPGGGGSRSGNGILLCYAVREEVGSIAALRRTNVLVTGMGRRNASEGIQAELASTEYRLVLTCGFAGGLNPALKVGAVVFSEDDGLGLSDSLLRLGAVPAAFHCARRVAVTAEEKHSLRRSTGADAVEMESSVIRTICRNRNVPSATIRVILDTADENLPLDFNALMTSHDKINYPKLIATLLGRPHKLFSLWRFQSNSILARKELDRVLQGLLRDVGGR